jgi:hypothetical protein
VARLQCTGFSPLLLVILHGRTLSNDEEMARYRNHHTARCVRPALHPFLFGPPRCAGASEERERPRWASGISSGWRRRSIAVASSLATLPARLRRWPMKGRNLKKKQRGIRTLLRDGVVLARAVQDPRLSDEILKSVRRKLEWSWPCESEAAFLVGTVIRNESGCCDAKDTEKDTHLLGSLASSLVSHVSARSVRHTYGTPYYCDHEDAGSESAWLFWADFRSFAILCAPPNRTSYRKSARFFIPTNECHG